MARTEEKVMVQKWIVTVLALATATLLIAGCLSSGRGTTSTTRYFAYVANTASADVYAYTINPNTGALTAVSGMPFPAGLGPSNLVADPAREVPLRCKL